MNNLKPKKVVATIAVLALMFTDKNHINCKVGSGITEEDELTGYEIKKDTLVMYFNGGDANSETAQVVFVTERNLPRNEAQE